jgi:hypothetical protein
VVAFADLGNLPLIDLFLAYITVLYFGLFSCVCVCVCVVVVVFF